MPETTDVKISFNVLGVIVKCEWCRVAESPAALSTARCGHRICDECLEEHRQKCKRVATAKSVSLPSR